MRISKRDSFSQSYKVKKRHFKMVLILRILFCFCLFISKSIASLPSPGRFTFTLNSYTNQEFGAVVKNVYKGTIIYMKIQCESDKISDSRIDDKSYINVGWVLRESKCWNEYVHLDSSIDLYPTYYNKPEVRIDLPEYRKHHSNYVRLNESKYQCEDNRNNFDYRATGMSQNEIPSFFHELEINKLNF